MFLAIAPEIYSVRDTASSLSFSNSAKKVKRPVQIIKTEDMPGTPKKLSSIIKDEDKKSAWVRIYIFIYCIYS